MVASSDFGALCKRFVDQFNQAQWRFGRGVIRRFRLGRRAIASGRQFGIALGDRLNLRFDPQKHLGEMGIELLAGLATDDRHAY